LIELIENDLLNNSATLEMNEELIN